MKRRSSVAFLPAEPEVEEGRSRSALAIWVAMPSTSWSSVGRAANASMNSW